MRRKHINPTQKITPGNGFLPILRNETPYYANLNRPAKSAYEFADTLSQYLSYGGQISLLRPGIDSTMHQFSVYEIVKITDDELIMPADPTEVGSAHNRYGIVVVEPEVDLTTGLTYNIVVCTFCSNFVYNDKTVNNIWKVANGSPLYLGISMDGMYLSGTPTSTDATAIGSIPIAVKTGQHSIFFSGTVRLFN